ncbi:MAG TPA: phosphate ABC transporter, permease protein PstA, partial [Nocardioides bacterium]|nr:phosphate ABC transporter, permease protein PstA [Nocardioides sp.]
MTTVDAPPRGSLPLAAARLPVWAPGLVAAVAFGASGLLALLAGWGITAFVVLAAFLFVAGLPLWSAVVEGRRGAMDRLMTSAVWTAFVAALIPLVWLIWTVLSEGLSTINSAFLTYDMRNVVGDDQGGIYHAIIGTLLVTAAAAIISVPVGLFCAIYLVEYGKGKQLARWITFLVDVMTGIPSIVAGLFALALFVLLFGPEIRLGFGGSVALSLLMI